MVHAAAPATPVAAAVMFAPSASQPKSKKNQALWAVSAGLAAPIVLPVCRDMAAAPYMPVLTPQTAEGALPSATATLHAGGSAPPTHSVVPGSIAQFHVGKMPLYSVPVTYVGLEPSAVYQLFCPSPLTHSALMVALEYMCTDVENAARWCA